MGFGDKKNSDTVNKTIEALRSNGIAAQMVSRQEAKGVVLKLIPKDSEVLTMTSVTLTDLGIDQAINEGKDYKAVRGLLYSQDPSITQSQKRKLGAAPDFVLGSVHAITEDGKIIIASNTGSQLPAYAYGAGKVIWVVGTQKIVKDLDQGLKRIEEYVVPLEDVRSRKAYGSPTNISKVLIINKEINPERLQVIFVDDTIGY